MALCSHIFIFCIVPKFVFDVSIVWIEELLSVCDCGIIWIEELVSVSDCGTKCK